MNNAAVTRSVILCAIFPMILCLLVLSSCTSRISVEKRRLMPGRYIHHFHELKNTRIESSVVTKREEKPLEIKDTHDEEKKKINCETSVPSIDDATSSQQDTLLFAYHENLLKDVQSCSESREETERHPSDSVNQGLTKRWALISSELSLYGSTIETLGILLTLRCLAIGPSGVILAYGIVFFVLFPCMFLCINGMVMGILAMNRSKIEPGSESSRKKAKLGIIFGALGFITIISCLILFKSMGWM